MLGKLHKTLLSLCFCGFISACSSQGGVKASQGNNIKKGQVSAHVEANAAPKPFYKNEAFQMLMGVFVLYGLSKIDKGLDMATLASNHSLKNKELNKTRTELPQE